MSTAHAILEEKARHIPQDSFRHTVVAAASRFKSTWVELGKLLVKVRNEALFSDWGYDSFETYCLKELHIRKQTALKLTRSFSFLERHEPKAERPPEEWTRKAPAFEVVEVLADAEERGQLSAEEYQSIRESIWNPQRPVADMRRELAERFPRPPPPAPSEAFQLRKLASLARKLSQELSRHPSVPGAVVERAGALAEDVEALASRTADA